MPPPLPPPLPSNPPPTTTSHPSIPPNPSTLPTRLTGSSLLSLSLERTRRLQLRYRHFYRQRQRQRQRHCGSRGSRGSRVCVPTGVEVLDGEVLRLRSRSLVGNVRNDGDGARLRGERERRRQGQVRDSDDEDEDDTEEEEEEEEGLSEYEHEHEHEQDSGLGGFGGFPFGQVTCISGADARVKSILLYHTLVAHLSSNPASEAVVIDSTGSFSVHILQDVAFKKLRDAKERVGTPPALQHEGYVYRAAAETAEEESAEPEDPDLLNAVTAILDRVKLVRIFDLTGLIETVSEISQVCRESEARVKVQRTVHNGPPSLAPKTPKSDQENPDESRIDLLAIDDLSSIFLPIQSRNGVEAQSLLTSFHRTLSHLVRNHSLCAILLNTVVANVREFESAKDNRHMGDEDEGISIFPSVVVKPALGKTLAHLIDLSLLISTMPEGRDDAETAYTGTTSQKNRGWSEVNVIEVLKDRLGGRQDRFAFFHVDGIEVRKFDGNP